MYGARAGAVAGLLRRPHWAPGVSQRRPKLLAVHRPFSGFRLHLIPSHVECSPPKRPHHAAFTRLAEVPWLRSPRPVCGKPSESLVSLGPDPARRPRLGRCGTASLSSPASPAPGPRPGFTRLAAGPGRRKQVQASPGRGQSLLTGPPSHYPTRMTRISKLPIAKLWGGEGGTLLAKPCET